MIRMMKLKIVAATMGVIVLGGGGAIAVSQLMAHQQASKPKASAAAPATRPATAAPASAVQAKSRRLIANSPKEALTMFAKAAREVDVEGMKSLVKIEDPKEEVLLLAACDFSGANAAFLNAVMEKFGEEST